MKRFALVILTEKISVKRFKFQQDFDDARAEALGKGIHVIPLDFNASRGVWVVPILLDWRI